MSLTFITWRVNERFYGLNLKKKMVVLEKMPWGLLDLLIMKKMAAAPKFKGMYSGYTHTYLVSSSHGKVYGGFFVTKLTMPLDVIQVLDCS